MEIASKIIKISLFLLVSLVFVPMMIVVHFGVSHWEAFYDHIRSL